MTTQREARGTQRPDPVVWLAPSRRLATLSDVLGRLAPGVRWTSDLSDLARHGPAPARVLVLDAEDLPLEDVGFVRRFVASAADARVTVVGDDAGARVARTLLALPRTQWMAWPPDLDAIVALAHGHDLPRRDAHGALADDGEDDAGAMRATTPVRFARRVETAETDDDAHAREVRAPRRAAGPSAAPASARATEFADTAGDTSDAARELAQIQAILEGAALVEDRPTPPRATRAGLASTRADEADQTHEEGERERAGIFGRERARGDADDLGAGDVFAHATEDASRPHPARTALAPDPRSETAGPESSAATTAAERAALAGLESDLDAPASDAGPFDAAFEVAFRPRPTPPRDDTRDDTRGETRAPDEPAPASPASPASVASDEPTADAARAGEPRTGSAAPFGPKDAPTWWRAQVADLADAAQRVQLAMSALRAVEPDDELELRDHVDLLDAEVARTVQFARTLGFIASPPSRGDQVFDLSDTVQLFLAQLASRAGGAPRCQFRAPEPVRVRSDRALIGTAFDAFFWLAGACSGTGDVVRAQVRRVNGLAEVRLEFPPGPLAGLDTERILEPYGLRRVLPDLGPNALSAASAIVFGQGGGAWLTIFPSGRLGWRIVLPAHDAPAESPSTTPPAEE